MKQLGLIGYPLSHSFSKKYFSNKFADENISGYHYELFPLNHIQALSTLLKEQPNLVGLNVTIPYKEQVIPFLKEMSESATAIGAVNTIVIKNGELKGFNTDAYGFEVSLSKMLQTQHKKALILGTGGAAKAIQYVLTKLNIEYKYVSRLPNEEQFSYYDLNKEIISEYKIIINTTPIGMSPNADDCPRIPYEAITDKHLLYDLVYNPALTLFLKQGKDKGASIKNGLEMLHLQAEKSWDIWQDSF
jgi:shikimate dehydrogenase